MVRRLKCPPSGCIYIAKRDGRGSPLSSTSMTSSTTELWTCACFSVASDQTIQCSAKAADAIRSIKHRKIADSTSKITTVGSASKRTHKKKQIFNKGNVRQSIFSTEQGCLRYRDFPIEIHFGMYMGISWVFPHVHRGYETGMTNEIRSSRPLWNLGTSLDEQGYSN